MCGGGGGSPKVQKAPPPPPPPKPQPAVQQEVEAQGISKQRNMNRGMGATQPSKTAETMLTGMDGVDQEELKKKLGTVQLLGGK